MNMSVLFAALAGAVVLWWLLARRLTEKPWLVEGPLEPAADAQPPARTGLWLFLAVATSLFFLLSTAYAIRMNYSDWRSLPEPAILWGTTALLVLASLAFQAAHTAARFGPAARLPRMLATAGGLSLAFVAGQLWAWFDLWSLGHFASSNPANAFFYLITGLHGLHLLGGLVVWGRTSYRLGRGEEPARLHLSVELCSLYWHFLLLIWLGMFALMLST